MAAAAATLTGALVWAAPVASAATAATGAPPGTPTAQHFAGIPTVGPLFHSGLDHRHSCTASVVASLGHDLILTAAHCVSGTMAGVEFAPGYDAGATPYGVWTVTHAYVDPAWLTKQDPEHDFAFLQLAPQRRDGRWVGVQDVTGGELLGQAPWPGQRITDVAYNAGLGDQAVRCSPRTYRQGAYPGFNCNGFVGGSSGSPWLVRVPGTGISFVDGVIGGLHQGGCFEYTSYSAPFGPDIYRLWLRASLGIHPDVVPRAGSDGC